MLQTHRCNIEEICDTLMEPNYFQMQHFITDSNWNHRDVIVTAAYQTSGSLRKVKLTGYLVDETGADGFYRNDYNLARKADLLGLPYMFDIHSNQTVYLEKLELVLPERKGNRGPQPKRLTVTEKDFWLYAGSKVFR